MSDQQPLCGAEVLLVEDAPRGRELLGEIRSRGGSVTLECGVESAAEVIRRGRQSGGRYDAVLLDLHPVTPDAISAIRKAGFDGFLAVVTDVPDPASVAPGRAGCDAVFVRNAAGAALAGGLGSRRDRPPH